MIKAKKEMIISEGSCNGEEYQFEEWMNKNYPEIDTCVKNALNGGYYEDGELIPENFWDQYCRS